MKDLLFPNDVNSTTTSTTTTTSTKEKSLEKVTNMINKLENLVAYDDTTTNGRKIYNIYLVKLYECLFEIYIDLKLFKLAAQIARQHILPAYKYV